MEDLNELNRLLKKDLVDEDVITLPTSIKMTKNAYAKAQAIGKMLEEKSSSSYEWYAFPLASKCDGYIIRDLILPRKQKISSAHVAVSGEDVALASAEVSEINTAKKFDNYIIGWLHSHANFNPFHSGTDTTNIMDVLNSVSLNTENVRYKSFNMIESLPQITNVNDKTIIKGKDLEDGVIEFTIKDSVIKGLLDKYKIIHNDENISHVRQVLQQLASPANLGFKQPIITGFCYSVVVNNIGSAPDTLMAVVEEEVFIKKKKQYTSKIPLEIVTTANDINLDLTSLKKLVDERIEVPKPFIYFGFGGAFGGKNRTKVNGFRRDEFEFDEVEGSHAIKSTNVTSYSPSLKSQTESLTSEELANKFVDFLFEIYESRGSKEKYIDNLITTTLANDSLEKAVEEIGAYTGSYDYVRFTPKLFEPLKDNLYEIIMKHVSKGNTSLVTYMRDILDAPYFKARDMLGNIDFINDYHTIKDVLSKDIVPSEPTQINPKQSDSSTSPIAGNNAGNIAIDGKEVGNVIKKGYDIKKYDSRKHNSKNNYRK